MSEEPKRSRVRQTGRRTDGIKEAWKKNKEFFAVSNMIEISPTPFEDWSPPQHWKRAFFLYLFAVCSREDRDSTAILSNTPDPFPVPKALLIKHVLVEERLRESDRHQDRGEGGVFEGVGLLWLLLLRGCMWHHRVRMAAVRRPR